MAKHRSQNDPYRQPRLHPETLMLGYGYDPALSEGAVKPPVFLTSTFVFKSAEEGRDFFDYVAGRREPPGRGRGLVYSRFNHPNSEIVEDRLAVYEGTETCALFSSRHVGDRHHAARLVRPGDVILHSQPLYGGTETLLTHDALPPSASARSASPTASTRPPCAPPPKRRMAKGRVSVILIETPSNPTNSLVDIALMRRIADEIGSEQGHRPIIVCDNTLLGPVFQRPLEHGADISLYSLTKYVGGHSDLIAGAALGSEARHRSRSRRCAAPSAPSSTRIPAGCSAARWKRSRCAWSAPTATRKSVARFLRDHPNVAKVHYLPFLPPDARQRARLRRAMHRRRLDLLLRHQGRRARGRSSSSMRCRSSSWPSASAAPNRSPAIPATMTHSGVPAECASASASGLDHPPVHRHRAHRRSDRRSDAGPGAGGWLSKVN